MKEVSHSLRCPVSPTRGFDKHLLTGMATSQGLCPEAQKRCNVDLVYSTMATAISLNSYRFCLRYDSGMMQFVPIQGVNTTTHNVFELSIV